MAAGELAGLTAIVSGASAGIGRAVAVLAAARGAAVVMIGRSAAALDTAAHAVAGSGGRVETVTGDAGDTATAQAALATARAAFGGVDILVNVAGAFPTASIEDSTDAVFDDAIAANLRTAFTMCRTVLPAMRSGAGGAIVNLSSMAARFGTPGLSVYGAAKAGVEALTRALAVEGAPRVRVNAVSAGPTLTESVRALLLSDTTGAVEAVTRTLPLQRMAEPDEIAETVLFLASRRASAITGQVLHANMGGLMA